MKKSVYEGQWVKVGDPLLELADFSQMWFVFEVYEPDIARAEAGIARITGNLDRAVAKGKLAEEALRAAHALDGARFEARRGECDPQQIERRLLAVLQEPDRAVELVFDLQEAGGELAVFLGAARPAAAGADADDRLPRASGRGEGSPARFWARSGRPEITGRPFASPCATSRPTPRSAAKPIA